MARTEITAQSIDRDGLASAFTAANADGHKLLNNGDQFIIVKNGGASPINVTIQTPATIEGIAIAEVVIAVAASAEEMIGNFPPSIFNQTDGMIYIDFSAVTDITVGAFKIA